MWRRLIESHYLQVMKAQNPPLSHCPFNMGGPCLITDDRDMWPALHVYTEHISFFFPPSLNFSVVSLNFHRNKFAIVRRTVQYTVCCLPTETRYTELSSTREDTPFLITILLISCVAFIS